MSHLSILVFDGDVPDEVLANVAKNTDNFAGMAKVSTTNLNSDSTRMEIGYQATRTLSRHRERTQM